MDVEINEFRLAFIWTRTLLCDRADGKTGPYSGSSGYEDVVAGMQKSGPANGFDLPWLRDKPFAHRFWVNVLGETNPGLVAPGKAWSSAVPLRTVTPPLKIVLPEGLGSWAPAGSVTDSRVYTEAFLYPFGVGLIVSFTVKGAMSGDSWVELSCSLGAEKLQGAYWDGDPFSLRLRVLAKESVTKLARLYFDPLPDAPDPGDPFTIMTVIQGSGVAADVAPGDSTRRQIQGAATLRPNWASAGLDDFVPGKGLIGIRGAASPGDLVYGAKRGRAIWSPSAFPSPPGRKNSLGCYNRNQVFAALQAEALCGLATAMYKRVQQNRDQPAHLDDMAKLANALLPAIHAGKDTYRSRSVQKQIDDNGVGDAMNCLAGRYGGPAWPPAPKP